MSEELWSIALPSGEVRRGTLEQLDEAYQSGAIDESSRILAPGATEWTTLGELLAGTTQSPSLRPIAMDLTTLVEAPPKSTWHTKAIVAGSGLLIAALIGAFALRSASGPEPMSAPAARPPAAPPLVSAEPTDSAGGPRLTDEQRKALLEADRLRELNRPKKPEREPPKVKGKPIQIDQGISHGGRGGNCKCKPGDPLCSCAD